MTVDRLEPLDKQRSKVFVDGDFAFVLYRGEIRRYHLEEGAELSEALYREILGEVLPKRAKERALHYIERQPRTEWETAKKLREGLYPEEIIGKTLEFLRHYHYLDDEAYVRNCLETGGTKKSRAEIFQFLSRKGIPRELMKTVYEEACPDTKEAIRRILIKRRYDPESATEEEKRKTAAYLIRRGFSYDEVSECLT